MIAYQEKNIQLYYPLHPLLGYIREHFCLKMALANPSRQTKIIHLSDKISKIFASLELNLVVHTQKNGPH